MMEKNSEQKTTSSRPEISSSVRSTNGMGEEGEEERDYNNDFGNDKNSMASSNDYYGGILPPAPTTTTRTRRSERQKVADAIEALAPHIHSPVPNPAPLGLFSFGLTTALLQMKHTRITGTTEDDMTGVENLVWGFALFYGGLLQLIAGLGEVRRNNLFGYTAFCSYGGFWMSYGTAAILVRFYGGGGATTADATMSINPKAVQAMLGLMGIFTFILWICTFQQNKTLCLLIFSLMMTFFLLAAGVDNEIADYVAGGFGIFTSAVAFFLAGAELVNDILGGGGDEEIIPLGHFDSNQFKFAGHFHVPGRIHDVTQTAMLQKSEFGPEDRDSPTLSVRFQQQGNSESAADRVEHHRTALTDEEQRESLNVVQLP